MRFACRAALVLTCLLPLAACASAPSAKTPAAPPTTGQMAALPVLPDRPSDLLPFFVVDARLAETLMGKSTVTAASLNINPILIPAHPVTTVLGAQVYVLRRPGFAVGIGGEFVHLHIVNQPVDATTGLPLGTAIERHFSSASPQLTFNFGRKRGWSYLSVGEAPISFDTYFVGNTPDGLRPVTLNYGGGGRWFSTKHVAYSVDLHFYATKPATPTLIVGQRARQTVIFFSMGISIR